MGPKQHSCARRSSTAPFLVLGLVLAMAAPILLATGCGAGSAGGSSETPGGDEVVKGIELAMSDLNRLAPAAPRADVDAAVTSMEQFAVDLYGELAKTSSDGNLVFSPSSIVTALTMTYAGAGGVTAEEMARTLHFSLDGAALHQAFNALDTALESRSFSEKVLGGGEAGVQIDTANSLWGQQGMAFEKPFLDTLAAYYGTGLRLVDFRRAAETARQAINAWVADQTHGRIPELTPEGTFKEGTSLMLINAIYLDATWMWRFAAALTTPHEFTTLAGTTVTVPMMMAQNSYPYGGGDGWQAVQLPYVGGKLAMLLIVPDAGRFAQVETALRPSEGGLDLIEQAVASLRSDQEVSLVVPKFTFRSQASLADALKALGMETPFTRDADFHGMTNVMPFYIDDVIHEAFIAVDEEGTEAAAATAVTMVAGSVPRQPIPLIVDRPFLFVIRDVETGALLFFGRVTDPSATEKS